MLRLNEMKENIISVNLLRVKLVFFLFFFAPDFRLNCSAFQGSPDSLSLRKLAHAIYREFFSCKN